MQAATGQQAMGPCPDAELLGLYAERSLADDERPAVEAHVAGCARCQTVVAAFVRSAPEAQEVGAGPGGESRAWWQGWRWLVPVTASAAVVMLAVWVGRPPTTSEVTPVAEDAAAAPGVAAGAAPQEPVASPGAAALPDRQAEAERELAFRAAPAGAVRDQLAAGKRQAAPAQASDLAKQAATAPPPAAARADAEAAATLADARERSAAAAAPPPPAPVATAEARETMAAPAPAAPAVAPRSPTALRAERGAAAQPAEMARAKASGAAPSTAGGASAVGEVTAAQAFRTAANLNGRVTYRTREALPAGAIVEVRLLDVSRVDAPAITLGRTEVVTRGEQVPIPFTVGYDSDAIDQRRRYALQATITIAGRVAYRMTTAQAVLTNGAPATNVEVVVQDLR